MAGAVGSTGSEEHEKQQQLQEMKHSMLTQILSNEARERLARIRIVKSDKASSIEDMLIRMAKGGQIRGRVTEQQLIDMLEQISEQKQSTPKVTFTRRRMDDSDEEDWDL